jgi:hypothetical protein
MRYQKVGGLHFIRVGRFGASFYVAKSRPLSPADQDARAVRISGALNAAGVIAGAAMLMAFPVLILWN